MQDRPHSVHDDISWSSLIYTKCAAGIIQNLRETSRLIITGSLQSITCLQAKWLSPGSKTEDAPMSLRTTPHPRHRESFTSYMLYISFGWGISAVDPEIISTCTRTSSEAPGQDSTVQPSEENAMNLKRVWSTACRRFWPIGQQTPLRSFWRRLSKVSGDASLKFLPRIMTAVLVWVSATFVAMAVMTGIS